VNRKVAKAVRTIIFEEITTTLSKLDFILEKAAIKKILTMMLTTANPSIRTHVHHSVEK